MATLSPFLGKSTPLPAERTVLVTPIVLEFVIVVKEGKIEGKLLVGDEEEEKKGSCFLKTRGSANSRPTFSPSGGRSFRTHCDVMDSSCLTTDNGLFESEFNCSCLEHPMNFNLTGAAIAAFRWMTSSGGWRAKLKLRRGKRGADC